jgi:ADP-ribosylglycohydrolase/catechol 2,3-dioxygenase-like lactoylglutathione lyase family enzyme
MLRGSVAENLTLRDKGRAAFWGAAAGDALGWPQEMPGRRVAEPGKERNASVGSFETWQRRSGGRFMPHQETIHAGEYSDDTQLFLCTARAIVQGRNWLQHLAFVELPTWSSYERGGGGATKRAVEILANGSLPWSDEIDIERKRRYFDAGGNGVAMRILPHSLRGAHDDEFLATSKAIFLNGICTHGHPRALLGALLYGYVAWRAFRHSGTLPYGYLIESALDDSSAWSALPSVAGVRAWEQSANQLLNRKVQELWSDTLGEIRNLLHTAASGIKAGALSIDNRVLSELGCFDRKINGAGTISAVASIYLASKYAPDPQHGLIEAAFSKGADTDTLASMVGGLLGAVAGLDWLQTYRNQLEDESYLERLAEQICTRDGSSDWDDNLRGATAKAKSAIDRFTRDLTHSSEGGSVILPDGRQARVQGREILSAHTTGLHGETWILRTADGQTLHIKKLTRPRTDHDELGSAQSPKPKKKGRFTAKVQALKLTVRDLERARSFYGETLGLKVKRESKNVVNFGGIICLVPLDYLNDSELSADVTSPTRSIICLEASNLELCHLRVTDSRDARVSAIREMAGRRFFRCVDPDQNVLEIFERQPKTAPKTVRDGGADVRAPQEHIDEQKAKL